MSLILLSSCYYFYNQKIESNRYILNRMDHESDKMGGCEAVLYFEDSIDFSVEVPQKYLEQFSYCNAMKNDFDKAERYRLLALEYSDDARDSIRNLLGEVELLEYANKKQQAINTAKNLFLDDRLALIDQSFLLLKLSELYMSIGKLDSAHFYIHISLIEKFNVESNGLYIACKSKECEILNLKGHPCDTTEIDVPSVIRRVD